MAENRALIADPNVMYTQNSLKDVSEVSKNLVSGDFERQYTNDIMEKPAKRNHAFFVIAATVAALAVWMLVLTMVREIQITRLRHEVDELTANMIAVTANVKSLNQKLASLKPLDDTFFADVDDVNDIVSETIHEKKSYLNPDSVEKLTDLTILEDDTNLADDEDMYEDDGDESGDYYQEYDRRTRKNGSTNMVKLKPDDFTDVVLTLEREKDDFSHIRELKRLLNKNPEDPNIGLPLSPPEEKDPDAREKRSVLPDPYEVDHYAAPRFISKIDERRKTKKYTPPENQPSKATLRSVTRTVRSDEEGSQKPFIAAHFHGNTSHLSTEIHEHYKGNGLLRVAHGAPHDVWYPSPWTVASPHPRPTLTRNGHVHVHHTGVYLVYAQIYYLDNHDTISWVLHRTNADTEGRDTLIQCAHTSHSAQSLEKANSCFSAAALLLRAGDRLAVRNTGGDRHSIMLPEKSFVGLVKLADAELPNEEF